MFDSSLLAFALLFFALVICPTCAGVIADGKGRDIGRWMLTGLVFGPLGVLTIAAMPAVDAEENNARRGRPSSKIICPFCAEAIRREATLCRYCRSDVRGTGDAA